PRPTRCPYTTLFRSRAAPEPRLLDQFRIDWFREMNGQLGDTLDTPAFVQRMTGNVARMRWLAAEILQRARNDHPDIDDHGLQERLGADADAAPSLLPVWYMPRSASRPDRPGQAQGASGGGGFSTHTAMPLA